MKKEKLKNIITQIRGVSYKKGDAISTPENEHLALLRANNIQNGKLQESDMLYVPNNLVNEKQIIKKGDIVIAASSGSINIVGKAGFSKNNTNSTFGAFCKLIRPNTKKVSPEYLNFYFQSQEYRTIISSLAQGANINNLRNEHIDGLEIILPPLSEQKRIATILEKADALHQKNKQLLDAYDDLLQATFLDMFGDPVTNPKGWKITEFGNAIIDIVGGHSFGGEQRPLKDDELGVLKVSAVTTGTFLSFEYKAILKNKIDKQIVHPQKGDLLFSRANTREMVGAVAIVDNDYDRLFLPDKLWRIDLDENKASQYYCHRLLSNDRFRPEMSKIATGTSGSMLNISKAKLRKLGIPLPPVELQNKFAQIVKNIEAQKTIIKQSLQESEDLFNGLIQKAFKGELN